MVAMMDTLAIYEQFRAVLGEERAKGFAQTLGTMIEEAENAATKEDIRLLREAQARTEARLERLEATVERLATIVEKLVIRSDRHEGMLLELTFRDRLPSCRWTPWL
ncbi:MAG: hypothetical protein ACKOWG_00580 [Planctomycetia bacterium]